MDESRNWGQVRRWPAKHRCIGLNISIGKRLRMGVDFATSTLSKRKAGSALSFGQHTSLFFLFFSVSKMD